MIRLLFERLIKLKFQNIIVTFVNTSLSVSVKNFRKQPPLDLRGGTGIKGSSLCVSTCLSSIGVLVD